MQKMLGNNEMVTVKGTNILINKKLIDSPEFRGFWTLEKCKLLIGFRIRSFNQKKISRLAGDFCWCL